MPRKNQTDLVALARPGTQEIAPSLDSIRAHYDHVQERAVEVVDWYLYNKRAKALWSWGLRFSAIFLVAVGSLVPLVGGALTNFKNLGLPEFAPFGYVAFALAGACLGFDRYMGISTSWMRYMTTTLALQRALSELQSDWLKLQIRLHNPPTPRQLEQLVDRLKRFALVVEDLVAAETHGWIAEFQGTLAELQRAATGKLEQPARVEAGTPRDGAIRIVLEGLDTSPGGVDVFVDGNLIVEAHTDPEVVLENLAAGKHDIRVRPAGSEDDEREVTQTVDVLAGATTQATVVLTNEA